MKKKLEILTPLSDEFKGKPVRTIEQVVKLANKGKVLYYRGGRTPAAFIQNFQARHLYNELAARVIFKYIPKKKHLQTS